MPRITITPAIEYKSTKSDSTPAGRGWILDGSGVDLQTGKRDYFWARQMPGFKEESTYVYRPEWRPEGRGWVCSKEKMPSGKIKYKWSRRVGPRK